MGQLSTPNHVIKLTANEKENGYWVKMVNLSKFSQLKNTTSSQRSEQTEAKISEIIFQKFPQMNSAAVYVLSLTNTYFDDTVNTFIP